MAEQTVTEDLDVAANDAVVNDIAPVEGDGLGSPTPSQPDPMSSEQIAQNPEISAAFDRVFGDGEAATATAEAPPATRSKQQAARRQEESVEELEGLDGATEADDGIEPPDGQQQTQQRQAVTQTQPDAQAQQAAEEDAASTLSPVLRQAAMRAGWDDKSISELHKQNPQMAEETFNRLLKSYNDLSAEYGRLGQGVMTNTDGTPTQPFAQQFQQPQTPPQVPQQQPPQPVTSPQQQAGLLGQLYGQEQVTALSEKYGADFMSDVVQPLLAPVQQMMQFVEQQQTQAMADQVNTYFGGLDEGFHDLYGNKGEVTEDQFENKTHVAMMADQIRTGARKQGIELPVSECLGRANMMFAAEHLGKLERKKITQQVQKRSKQLTQRPSQRQVVRKTGERSDEAAADALSARAHELGLEEFFG